MNPELKKAIYKEAQDLQLEVEKYRKKAIDAINAGNYTNAYKWLREAECAQAQSNKLLALLGTYS